MTVFAKTNIPEIMKILILREISMFNQYKCIFRLPIFNTYSNWQCTIFHVYTISHPTDCHIVTGDEIKIHLPDMFFVDIFVFLGSLVSTLR
jgi:hypothetical protein